jgi:hypothetical protein
MSTLLHEAAHGVAAAKGLKDTSRGGRYHNRVFKTLAEELGLEVKEQESRGLAATSVPKDTAKKWTLTVKRLDKAIKKNFRFMEPQMKPKEACRLLKAECSCGRKIRVARAVFEAAPIVCGACEEAFEIA